jgi:hypothetical protein
MDITAIALQQVALQSATGLSMIKQAAQQDQALVQMVDQVASDGSRGQNLDISI